MKILITGGCGFVGSSLAIALKEKYPSYDLVVFDNLKRKGSELNLNRLRSVNVTFQHGDLRFKNDIDEIRHVDLIIDAAAEPSVQAGIDGGSPDYLFETNLNGTYNTLELARKHKAAIIFLSTSRVYSIPSLEDISYTKSKTRFEIDHSQIKPGITKNGIDELFDTGGFRSLYGTTKLASELLINEYNAMFGIQTVINRCGVLTGPWQMGKVDQGFVVLWLAKHLWKGELAYIGYQGSGKQVRDILHVEDLFSLIDWQIHNIDVVNGKTMNVGGGMEGSVSLLEMTDLCQSITGNKIAIQPILENRKADIPIYITDNSTVTSLTGWKPTHKPKDIIQEIYNWMKENENQLKPILQ